MRLFLFDIDGTLLLAGVSARLAVNRTFAELYGVAEIWSQIDLAGATDAGWLKEAIALASGREAAAGELEQVNARYVGHLAELLPQAADCVLLPGVAELLAALVERQDCCLGLQTGNLAAVARMKLEKVDMARYFPVGGFGSDSASRREVVRLAIERSCAFYGCAFAPEEILLVGDTPKDISAAKENGIKSLAVTTGYYGAAELRGADWVVDSLVAFPWREML